MKITQENKKDVLKEIQSMREVKGKEDETLEKIEELKDFAEQEKDFDLLSTLYWEESLIWQHLVMTEVAKKPEEVDVASLGATEKMSKAAQQSYAIIKANNLTKKEATALRFLGRVANYAGDHKTARDYYQDAIQLLSKDSQSRLEIEGFLASTLILLGHIQDGLDMAKRVYADYDRSELGKALKAQDYYVWAVWKTGIPPRVFHALKEVKAKMDTSDMKNWLNDAMHELKHPSVSVTWGDEKFQFRIDELNACLAES